MMIGCLYVKSIIIILIKNMSKISSLTQEFINKSEGMLNVQPEIRDNENRGYLMFDTGGVEVCVGEFLYGITKLLKPQRVLTTGIYTGISDMYIGQALKENEYGNSTALEIEPQHLARAVELWKKVGVFDQVTAQLTESLAFEPTGEYQLMFLDSEPHLRFHELVKFYPYLAKGGYVFIHDTPRNLCQGNINPDHPNIASWPFGDLPVFLQNEVKKRELQVMHFPNPRGLIGFYRIHPDDYIW